MTDHGFVIRLANSCHFFQSVHVMLAAVETIFAKVEVLTFRTVKSLPPYWLPLRRAFIAKILLSQRLVNLGAVGLPDLITQCYCFR